MANLKKRASQAFSVRSSYQIFYNSVNVFWSSSFDDKNVPYRYLIVSKYRFIVLYGILISDRYMYITITINYLGYHLPTFPVSILSYREECAFNTQNYNLHYFTFCRQINTYSLRDVCCYSLIIKFH